jgi:hypothetical protein
MRKQGHHIDVFQATEERNVDHSEWEEIEKPVFTKKPKTLESAKAGDKVLDTRCDMLYVVLFKGEDFTLLCGSGVPYTQANTAMAYDHDTDFRVVDSAEEVQ